MTTLRKGTPFVLSAASGTGKTTISHRLLAGPLSAELMLSVSTTTRKPRGKEKDGVDYNFVDERRFHEMMECGAFIEWAEVHGNFYGSDAGWTAAQLDDGRDVLFDIDVQGGRQLKERFEDACLIFILPPSIGELEERLRGRGTDADDVVRHRLLAARAEIRAGLDHYDICVVNDDLDRAVEDVESIIRSRRLTTQDRKQMRRNLLGDG